MTSIGKKAPLKRVLKEGLEKPERISLDNSGGPG